MIFASNLAIFNFFTTIFALVFGLFLFWRAGRRDLLESEFLFDTSVIAFFGALIFGRVLDFILRFDYYQWSFGKLIFFNVYKGFDFYGALVGVLVFLFIFLRGRRNSFWVAFDLAGAPIAFGVSLVFLFKLFADGLAPNLLYFVAYFVIFWLLKRLEARKRHTGFFGCVFLILFSIFNIFLIVFESRSNLAPLVKNYDLAVLLVLLLFGSISWYLISKRRAADDIKSFIAVFLLSIFKFRRIITSLEEANHVARSIILLSYNLVKGTYFLVKLIGRELYISFLDLVRAFGVKR